MQTQILLSLLAAGLFSAVHLAAPALYRLGHVPRAWWVSAAGGVAVAYVFLHLIPDLASHEEALMEAESRGELVYVLALAGLAAFYGLERRVRRARPEGGADPASRDAAFWIHIGSFSLYNMLIGYLLLHREEDTLSSLLMYVGAIGLHFVTADIGLRHDHRRLYDGVGRWLLVGGVLAGALLGLVAELPEQAIIALSSFLAGGIVLNTLKEELPENRESRFAPFALGAAGYGAILLLLSSG
ncbi:hypothetical protein [Pseudoroseicyclus tamaricis]|uniref:ZIP family zinc transporter n=1 Tax=Pseudoroseicyclus tamaricis TaxID=2705421 RepID=A0A6B2JSA0_9RHOB|nr:hypothetical protein [Pseudoroseicyclus tamaricis]NDV00850.1 hypothetical protein [Pseudoroseicyclus tamaricis]